MKTSNLLMSLLFISSSAMSQVMHDMESVNKYSQFTVVSCSNVRKIAYYGQKYQPNEKILQVSVIGKFQSGKKEFKLIIQDRGNNSSLKVDRLNEKEENLFEKFQSPVVTLEIEQNIIQIQENSGTRYVNGTLAQNEIMAVQYMPTGKMTLNGENYFSAECRYGGTLTFGF